MEPVITADGLTKEYRRYRRPFDRIKEVLPGLRPRYTPFVALEDVSFSVARGETVGIVGQNGAGKSTLLQILSGVLEPTRGRFEVRGRVGSLLELGAGFHPDFSGVENVRLQGRLLNLPPGFVEERLPAILEFADIGDFAREPVKNYSSGMFVRLAFATAVHLDPEVLIVDEALSVGDVFFQHKCIERMKRFQREGKTILVVSHDPQTIRHLCDRALHLRAGRLVGDGDPAAVVARFLQEKTSTFSGRPVTAVSAAPAPLVAAAELPPLPAGLERFGAGGARVLGAAVCGAGGAALDSAAAGDELVLKILAEAGRDLARTNLGFMLRDKKGLDVSGSNLAFEGAPTPPLARGERLLAEFRFTLPELAPGSYAFSVAVAEGDDTDYETLDWVENACILQIHSKRPVLGHIRFAVEARAGRPVAKNPQTGGRS